MRKINAIARFTADKNVLARIFSDILPLYNLSLRIKYFPPLNTVWHLLVYADIL